MKNPINRSSEGAIVTKSGCDRNAHTNALDSKSDVRLKQSYLLFSACLVLQSPTPCPMQASYLGHCVNKLAHTHTFTHITLGEAVVSWRRGRYEGTRADKESPREFSCLSLYLCAYVRKCQKL